MSTADSRRPTVRRLHGSLRWGASCPRRPTSRLSLAALCAVTAALFVSTTPALALGGKHIFSGSFGGAGTSTLSEPAGVAVNESSGDVYVVDKGNNRVEYFTASGGYLGQFNGSGLLLGEGSGVPHGVFPGQFSSPEAIAVDNACQRHTPELTEVTTPTCNEFDPSNGDVYVADTGHKVIDKFSASGAYLGQLTEADGAPFGGLFGVAVDQTGTVWVFQESGEIDSFSDAEVNGFLSSRKLALWDFTWFCRGFRGRSVCQPRRESAREAQQRGRIADRRTGYRRNKRRRCRFVDR